MLRSILVALDGSASSLAAGRFVIDLARRHGASLMGLGVVNSAWIERPEPVPVGAMAFKTGVEASRLARATQRVHDQIAVFHESARQVGLTAVETAQVEGDPVAIVETEATSHDLVVLGRGSVFDVEADTVDVPMCVERLVRAEPRPILMVPDQPPNPAGPVLVGFDGSPASSRALHMFALLGLARDRAVHVMSLDRKSAEAAKALAERAGALLSRHGVVPVHTIGLDAESGNPAEAILGLVGALEVGLVAMGAFGHSGIREIFGSCTRRILRRCPTALFLHH